MTADWIPAGEDLKGILGAYEDPLHALSLAEVPALMIRNAYPPAQCAGLIDRFIERGLMPTADAVEIKSGRVRRIDIGTGLGGNGNDQEEYFRKSAKSAELLRTLFDGFDNPISVIYDTLSALAGEGRRVVTAYEPDGRQYCPAIFRIHYDGHRYVPHIDHVTLREKRFNYEVTRFDHQFAGVLCVQNSVPGKVVPQAILHRCLWTEEVQPHIEAHTFDNYKTAYSIEHHRVDLEVGDLYFFNTRCIHEVPFVEGTQARVVLAVFIGFSDDDDEIYVWC